MPYASWNRLPDQHQGLNLGGVRYLLEIHDGGTLVKLWDLLLLDSISTASKRAGVVFVSSGVKKRNQIIVFDDDPQLVFGNLKKGEIKPAAAFFWVLFFSFFFFPFVSSRQMSDERDDKALMVSGIDSCRLIRKRPGPSIGQV